MRIALRTQQVIAHETGVVNTADPLGGSLLPGGADERAGAAGLRLLRADRRARRGRGGDRGELLPVRDRRGALPLPAGGRDASNASWSASTATSSKTRQQIPILKVDPALEGEQIARVQALRARRDDAAAEQALAALKEAAAGTTQPDGPDHRGRQGRRHDGRDVRHPPRRLGHLARNARFLTKRRVKPSNLSDSTDERAGRSHQHCQDANLAPTSVLARSCCRRLRWSRCSLAGSDRLRRCRTAATASTSAARPSASPTPFRRSRST